MESVMTWRERQVFLRVNCPTCGAKKGKDCVELVRVSLQESGPLQKKSKAGAAMRERHTASKPHASRIKLAETNNGA